MGGAEAGGVTGAAEDGSVLGEAGVAAVGCGGFGVWNAVASDTAGLFTRAVAIEPHAVSVDSSRLPAMGVHSAVGN